jgi:hypothetical protein
MAKVKMPLFSLAAKGTFAKGAITFCSHISRNQAKHYSPDSRKNIKPLESNKNLFREAQKYWNWLPDYAKWLWNNCVFTQPLANKNSPWRAAIKGRVFFFRQACIRIKEDKRPNMTPYDDCRARIIWDTEPVRYVSE